MLDFLTTIMDALSMGISYLFNAIKGLFTVFSLIPQGVAFINTIGSYLPSALGLFIGLGITISLCYLVINR